MTRPILSDNKFYIVDRDGNIDVNAVNGDFYTQSSMPEDFICSQFFIAFYNSERHMVAPKSGTISVQASPIPGQWHTVANGDIDATLVAPNAFYYVPYISNYIEQGRIIIRHLDDGDIAFFNAFFVRTK